MRRSEHMRVELLAALSKLSQLRPEWRLGQTLANLAMTAGRLDAGGVWDLEDEEALRAAKTLIEECSESPSVLIGAAKTGAGKGQKKPGRSRLPSRKRAS